MIKSPSKWENIDHQDILTTFPILSEEDIGNVTLGKPLSDSTLRKHGIFFSLKGVFQLKRARAYAQEKSFAAGPTDNLQYPLQRSRDYQNIIRVPTQSAHSSRVTYRPIIEFTQEQILNWWCDCPIGNRHLGCCSRIASAIWFLSFKRSQTQQRQLPL